MYSTEMDMALTFSYMVSKGPAATAFVKKNSPEVQKKFDLIADILESVKATERGYMRTLLADDLSRLKSYVPYALAVRLEREYSGVWTVPKDEEKTDDDQAEEPAEKKTEAAAPRRIGDPVEVAGRRIDPLILALETKNSRLFEVLMQNKVNPNVANDRKVSALMLAIANNDPEQVKALLDAGAKVTQEAARAGTASGVNAEIVKMLNSYLPGVRQADAPEKKKPEKTSASDSRKPVDNALTRRLKEAKFDHLELEEVNLSNFVQLVRTKSRELDPGGKGIQISFPTKYSGSPVTISAERVSLYDLLRMVCNSTGLEMLVEDPDRVILYGGSDPARTDAAKKNAPAKNNQ